MAINITGDKNVYDDIVGIRGSGADEYKSTGKSYSKDEPCIQNNIVYTAKQAITAPAGEFDPSKWNESSLASLMNGVNANADAINAIIKTVSESGTTESYGEVITSVSLTKKLVCVDMESTNRYAIPYHGSHGYWCLKVFNIVTGVEANKSVSWTAYYID